VASPPAWSSRPRADQRGEREGDDHRPVYQLGQPIGLSSSGFAPGAEIRLSFGAYLLKTITTTDGSLSASIMPPVFDGPGYYWVMATGLAPDGTTLVLRRLIWYGPRPAGRERREQRGDRGNRRDD
jgi:hypothetical protein